MITVELIQFLMPNGRQKLVHTNLPDECLADYEDMKAANCRLECEMLSTGVVSLTVADDGEDIDIELVPNGPEVHLALSSMLRRRLWRTSQSIAEAVELN